MTAIADAARARTRYPIRLQKVQGDRALPYWDTLFVNPTAGTVTFAVTLPAEFRGPDICGEKSCNGEVFSFKLSARRSLTGSLHWHTHSLRTPEDAPEDTIADVEEDDRLNPDRPRR